MNSIDKYLKRPSVYCKYCGAKMHYVVNRYGTQFTRLNRGYSHHNYRCRLKKIV